MLQSEPDSIEVLNSIAWILATTEDENIKDHTKAVKIAQKACDLTDYKEPNIIDTLAAAYAAGGNFSKAIETAEKALKLAVSANSEDIVQIEERLKLYRQNLPYYEPGVKKGLIHK